MFFFHLYFALQDMSRKTCLLHRSKTAKQLQGLPAMCRRHFTISAQRTNFYDAIYSPSILILNTVVVAFVMLLSASGNRTVMTFFGMSAGTAVAVINYISQVFSPVESLGMEIQTIQSAVAGIHRINEFFELEERKDNEKNTAEMQRFLIAPPLTSDVRSHCKFLKWLEILYSGLEMEKDRGFRREKL